MKKYLSYAVIAFFASSVLALAGTPDKDAMMAKETAAWQAFKDKNADGFKKVVDHDMIGVYADGIADMAKEMSDMQKWDMKSFKISDYKIHSDEKDVIVANYVVTLEGTYDGQDASGTYQRRLRLEAGKRQMARHFPHQREAGLRRGRPRRAEERIASRLADASNRSAHTSCALRARH